MIDALDELNGVVYTDGLAELAKPKATPDAKSILLAGVKSAPSAAPFAEGESRRKVHIARRLAKRAAERHLLALFEGAQAILHRETHLLQLDGELSFRWCRAWAVSELLQLELHALGLDLDLTCIQTRQVHEPSVDASR